MLELFHVVAVLALAQGETTEVPPESLGGILTALGPAPVYALMFAVIYFLLIRPANKQRKEQAAMLNALKKDDEVVTAGGIVGRIVNIDEKIATLEVADKVKIRVMRDRLAGKYIVASPTATK